VTYLEVKRRDEDIELGSLRLEEEDEGNGVLVLGELVPRDGMLSSYESNSSTLKISENIYAM
jgi:hypothetical protein